MHVHARETRGQSLVLFVVPQALSTLFAFWFKVESHTSIRDVQGYVLFHLPGAMVTYMRHHTHFLHMGSGD